MTSTETKPAGPEFSSRKPRMNHVAMSLSPEMLDEEHRQVFQVHNIEQFVFLIADEPHMTAPRMDHFGMSVATKDEFDEVARRAAAWKAKEPDDVDLVDPSVEEYDGFLNLHSFYVRYRLPLMVETQHFEWLG